MMFALSSASARPSVKAASRSRTRMRPLPLRCAAFLSTLLLLWTSVLAAPVAALAPQTQANPKAGPSPATAPRRSPLPSAHRPEPPRRRAYWSLPPRPAHVNRPTTRLTVRLNAPASLLDENGRLLQALPTAQLASWRRDLSRAAHLTRAQAAWRQLWVGEWELGANEQPQRALARFARAAHLASRNPRLRSLAAYDSAIAHYAEGAYAEAAEGFGRLLANRPARRGLDLRACALWLHHARACSGYHQERARLQIPEPPRLDPRCGIAALAAWLRANRMPYSQAHLRALTRMTGRGSSLQDLKDAAERLGLHAYAVSADEVGLQQLPLPAVAYVEHDHFISVISADAHGVSYLCSDCGPWPGGRVSLTWAQWRKLEASALLVLTRPGSDWDRALAHLERV